MPDKIIKQVNLGTAATPDLYTVQDPNAVHQVVLTGDVTGTSTLGSGAVTTTIANGAVKTASLASDIELPAENLVGLDESLSSTSTNAVQNKVIYEALQDSSMFKCITITFTAAQWTQDPETLKYSITFTAAQTEQLSSSFIAQLQITDGTTQKVLADQMIKNSDGSLTLSNFDTVFAGQVLIMTGISGTADIDDVRLNNVSVVSNKIANVVVSPNPTTTGTETELKALNIGGTIYKIPEQGITTVDWGDIEGTLSDQTDLQNALNAKATTTDLTDGTIVVKTATDATNATKATQDANGNVITSTYATQTALSEVADDLEDVKDLIPDAATTSNQLADKAFVNSSIQSSTSTFRGNFDTKAALDAYTGEKKSNDYAVVNSDETHSNQMSRYKYNGTAWVYEYKINDTPMTAAQLAALNSGATAAKISSIDDKYELPTGGIPATDLAESYYLASNPSGYTTNTGTVTSVQVQAGTGLTSSTSTAQTQTLNTTISVASTHKLPTTSEWAGKQDVLDSQTAYTSKGSATKVAQITTNNLGQVTNIAEVDITKTTLSDLGITATATELNYSDGVTSNIQTQLNGKQATLGTQTAYTAKGTATKVPQITTNTLGQVTAITEVDITKTTLSDLGITASASELNVLDGITATTAELNYTDGVTSNIQTQLNNKQATLSTQTAYSAKGSGTKVPQITTNTLGQVTGITEVDITKTTLTDMGVTATAAELNTLDGITATTTELNVLDGITATTTELNYTDGVTSNIQDQIDNITTAYIKTAAVTDNTLTLIKQDNNSVTFTPKLGRGILLSNYSNIDNITVEQDATKGVAPYNTSYYYTNITVDTTKVDLTEEDLINGIVISIQLNAAIASSYRNVRIRFGESGNWIPLFYAASILPGSSYLSASAVRHFVFGNGVYSTETIPGAFHMLTDSNSTYSPMSLGFGYGVCDTAESTTAKVVTLASYSLTANGAVSVKFTYAVPVGATLNINSKGAKPIYYKGVAITAGIINAGDIGHFVYTTTPISTGCYVLLGTDAFPTAAEKATWNTVTSKADDSAVVHLANTEYITGSKMFSYSSSNVTSMDEAGIMYSPASKYFWHDVAAFATYYSPTLEVTADGSTWTSSTLNKNLFAQKENQAIQIIKASGQCGSRWTWSDTSWSNIRSILLGFTYNASPATVTILVEGYNSSWITLFTSTGGYNATPYLCWLSSSIGAHTKLRLTITKDASDTTTACSLSCIKLLTKRWGDQGRGSELEYPYTWDADGVMTLNTGSKVGSSVIATAADLTGKANLEGGNTFEGSQNFEYQWASTANENAVTNQLRFHDSRWDIFTCRDLTNPETKTAIAKGYVWCQENDGTTYSRFNSTNILYGYDDSLAGYETTLTFPTTKNGTYTLATTSDINNPTITFTQGGVTKGTITLNQSGDQTIALAGSGSGGGCTEITTGGSTYYVDASGNITLGDYLNLATGGTVNGNVSITGDLSATNVNATSVTTTGNVAASGTISALNNAFSISDSTNVGMEIGYSNKGTAGAVTPYLDFHTGYSNDYDARFIVTGGTAGTNGAGNLNFFVSNLGINGNYMNAEAWAKLIALANQISGTPSSSGITFLAQTNAPSFNTTT